MKTLTLKHIVWKEGRHYVAQSLNVEVSSFGDTKREALANLREALELYFEDVRRAGRTFLFGCRTRRRGADLRGV